MKRRIALLAMLGAIPGLGFLKPPKPIEKKGLLCCDYRCEREWTVTIVDMQDFSGSFGLASEYPGTKTE